MKTIMILFLFLMVFLGYSQSENKVIYIYFNPKIDKIKNSNNLTSYKLKFNNKFITFLQSDVRGNYEKNKLVNPILYRNEILQVIDKDNSNKNIKYILIKKQNGKYYYINIDHIFRDISCE